MVGFPRVPIQPQIEGLRVWKAMGGNWLATGMEGTNVPSRGGRSTRAGSMGPQLRGKFCCDMCFILAFQKFAKIGLHYMLLYFWKLPRKYLVEKDDVNHLWEIVT